MTAQYKIDLRAAVADLDTPCTEPPKIYRPNLTQEIHKPMSPQTRAKYAFFFDGLDEYLKADDGLVTSELKEAAKHTHAHLQEYAKVQEIREQSHAVADAYRARNSRIIKDMDEARSQLKALRVGDVLNVEDSLTERVQRLCSYYNNKDDGRRFKTRRAPSTPEVLQVKRFR